MSGKHTQGPIKVIKDPRPGTHNFDIVGSFNAAGNGIRLANVTSGPANVENGFLNMECPTQGAANAELIAEAFNVAHETGLTPRRLAENYNAYKEMCEEAVEAFQPYLQCGGRFAHLMPLGVSMTKIGPNVLVAEIDRVSAQRDELLAALLHAKQNMLHPDQMIDDAIEKATK